jgi:hypothetical protein
MAFNFRKVFPNWLTFTRLPFSAPSALSIHQLLTMPNQIMLPRQLYLW